MQPKVFVLTINYNNTADTIEFIRSICSSDYSHFSIIIVDNSSDELSKRSLNAFFLSSDFNIYTCTENSINENDLRRSFITVIDAANRGYAAANNIVLKFFVNSTSLDYVLAINNDVIVAKDAVRLLVERYERELKNNIGIVAPIIYYLHNNKIWSAGGYFFKSLGLLIGYHKNRSTFRSNSREINFLTGCAWLIRSDRIKRIGLLDEAFFMYAEDLDYSLKARQQNFTLEVEFAAKIWHKVGASSKGAYSAFSSYWMMFGRLRVVRKHNSFVGRLLGYTVLIGSRIATFPYHIIKGRSFVVKTQLKAIADSFK